MKATLLILAACLTCGWCATHGLESVPNRPTPINPAVISEPKPADKITVIKDPKEVEKYKRDAPQKPVALQGPTPSSTPKRQHPHTTRKAVKPSPTAAPTRPAKAKKQHDEAKHRQKRDHDDVSSTVKPVPLIHRHHEVPSQQPEDSAAHKRDIPVPLVAKFEHPEESPKSDEQPAAPSTQKPHQHHHHHTDQVPVEDLHDHIQVIPPKASHAATSVSDATTSSTSSTTSTTTIHPAVRPHPVPVSELFARPVPHSSN